MNESQEARAIAALTWMTTHFKWEQTQSDGEGHVLDDPSGPYSPELQDAMDLLVELYS